ncbi:hypothetical protein HYC85_030588 [Camellia sinensis]|uniref:Endonuclease/exonuclease/phosphatase domain-containing protein n=1 Tax=Camellia sinensis TaxID=4442 RepID=A0A7J7G1R8_CAMSI|nr:hypothetical protein HYC85_030588 [Camellia sinensis]
MRGVLGPVNSFCMIFLSWNVRGLRRPEKRRKIKNLVRERKIDVLLLQETKRSKVDEMFLKSLWPWEELESMEVGAEGSVGGLLCLWNPQIFELKECCSNRNFVLLLEAEIWAAIIDCDGNKAPGPDGSEIRKKVHLVSWKEICLSKDQGRLGVRNLSQVNECLLIKWWWRYGKEDSALWKQVVCSKYGGLGGRWSPFLGESLPMSNLWKGALSVVAKNPDLRDFLLQNFKDGVDVSERPGRKSPVLLIWAHYSSGLKCHGPVSNLAECNARPMNHQRVQIQQIETLTRLLKATCPSSPKLPRLGNFGTIGEGHFVSTPARPIKDRPLLTMISSFDNIMRSYFVCSVSFGSVCGISVLARGRTVSVMSYGSFGSLVHIWCDGAHGIFWANFEPKIEWAPNVFYGGFEEVKCSLPHGKSHGEDGSSKPFMSEWEHDVVFGCPGTGSELGASAPLLCISVVTVKQAFGNHGLLAGYGVKPIRAGLGHDTLAYNTWVGPQGAPQVCREGFMDKVNLSPNHHTRTLPLRPGTSVGRVGTKFI